MKSNPLQDDALIKHSAGTATVTRKTLPERAVELATLDDRSAQDVSKSDWNQARRGLTDPPNIDSKEAILESAPESERWDPLPGSTGHKVDAVRGEDEDDEGRSDNEKLVEEGVAEAELDQMRQASKTAL